MKRDSTKAIAVTLASMFIALVIGESVCRLFSLDAVEPITLRFGYDTGVPVFDTDGVFDEGVLYSGPLFAQDPVALWRPIPDTPVTGSDGLRRPSPLSKFKPPGTLRLGILGDSCSFLGQPLYAEHLAHALHDSLGAAVDIVNASCPGYSSTQGLARLNEVLAWDVDVLIIAYGWNDHWPALTGLTDSATLRRMTTRRNELGSFAHSSLLRALLALYERQAPIAGGLRPVRVPPEEYKSNLMAMAQLAAKAGCRIVWLTAPTALDAARMPDWANAFWGQYYDMSPPEVANIPAMHASYNDIVRFVAQSNAAGILVDLASSWHPSDSDSLFRGDMIHYSRSGHSQVAQAVYRELVRRGVLKTFQTGDTHAARDGSRE